MVVILADMVAITLPPEVDTPLVQVIPHALLFIDGQSATLGRHLCLGPSATLGCPFCLDLGGLVLDGGRTILSFNRHSAIFGHHSCSGPSATLSCHFCLDVDGLVVYNV